MVVLKTMGCLVLLGASLGGCSLLFDEQSGGRLGIDAAPGTVDGSNETVVDARVVDAAQDELADAVPAADAFSCQGVPRLSIDILNPAPSSGDVELTINGVIDSNCAADDETCFKCVPEGSMVSLKPKPAVGSSFTMWNQCGPRCSGGTTADPCDFVMPDADVGCLANFAAD